MGTPVKNILPLIPQRPPLVMVDKLLYNEDTVTRSSLLIRDDNIFVENGELREPGLVENIAQTAAARAGYVSQLENKPVQVGYIGAIKNLEIYSFPKTGDEIVTEIIVKNQIFEVTIISGTVSCNGMLLAQCEMKIFIKNP
ncbi:MAG: 3-hydroxyacyl-ACP dehydratase [Chitinophagaceae bacterium]